MEEYCKWPESAEANDPRHERPGYLGGGGWKEAMSILGFDTKCEQEHSEPIELESSRGRRGSLGIRLPQLFLRGEERSNMAEKQMGFI